MRAALAAVVALAGCATVDVYDWSPRPLPAGSQPLAVVASSLNELRDITWSYGEPDPDPTRHAIVEARPGGVAAAARHAAGEGLPLDLSYAEITNGVRMVTQLNGLWTVFIYDRYNRLIQMEFNSYQAARRFLDAAHALALAG